MVVQHHLGVLRSGQLHPGGVVPRLLALWVDIHDLAVSLVLEKQALGAVGNHLQQQQQQQ